jgi:hypothetical protein
MESHGRCHQSALRELLVIWRTGLDLHGRHYEFIPGYEAWPAAAAPGGVPAGWSESNLRRACAPDDYDTAAARLGLFDASAHRPPLLTTRVGLRCGERVEFDDHVYNVKILYPGQLVPSRPMGFCAVDVLSGWAYPSFRPTLWDTVACKRLELTEREFWWFVIAWLTEFGYRDDERGTTFVCENAKAVVREAQAQRISDATHGRVKISLGPMFDQPAHAGQFTPRAKGNFMHKPLVEGFFNPVDNYFDHLAGQTGNNRHEPAELAGRLAYTVKTLAAITDLVRAGKLSRERAATAQIPLLTWGEFSPVAFAIFEALNASPDHDLEGWSELGFETIEYHLDGCPPLPAARLQALDPARRALIEAQATARARRLSRAEVWQAHKHELTPVGPEHYSYLFGLEAGIEITVGAWRGGLITITDPDLVSKPAHFLAVARDGRHLRNGDKYLAFLNPLKPSVVQLTKANGEPVALCDAWAIPCKSDEEAIRAQMGAQRSWLAARAQMLAGRHAGEAAARADLLEHNRLLLDQHQQRGCQQAQEQLAERAEAALDRNAD